MAWASKFNKLTVAGDELDLTALDGKKFIEVLAHIIDSGAISVEQTLNDLGTSIYANRFSTDGAADTTETPQTSMAPITGSDADHLIIQSIINISGNETLVISKNVDRSTAGAGNPPKRREGVFKTSNTDQKTRVDMHNPEAGSYDEDSLIAGIETDD